MKRKTKRAPSKKKPTNNVYCRYNTRTGLITCYRYGENPGIEKYYVCQPDNQHSLFNKRIKFRKPESALPDAPIEKVPKKNLAIAESLAPIAMQALRSGVNHRTKLPFIFLRPVEVFVNRYRLSRMREYDYGEEIHDFNYQVIDCKHKVRYVELFDKLWARTFSQWRYRPRYFEDKLEPFPEVEFHKRNSPLCRILLYPKRHLKPLKSTQEKENQKNPKENSQSKENESNSDNKTQTIVPLTVAIVQPPVIPEQHVSVEQPLHITVELEMEDEPPRNEQPVLMEIAYPALPLEKQATVLEIPSELDNEISDEDDPDSQDEDDGDDDDSSLDSVFNFMDQNYHVVMNPVPEVNPVQPPRAATPAAPPDVVVISPADSSTEDQPVAIPIPEVVDVPEVNEAEDVNDHRYGNEYQLPPNQRVLLCDNGNHDFICCTLRQHIQTYQELIRRQNDLISQHVLLHDRNPQRHSNRFHQGYLHQESIRNFMTAPPNAGRVRPLQRFIQQPPPGPSNQLPRPFGNN